MVCLDSEVFAMQTKEIITELRTKAHLTQSQLAEKVHATRQAVSRWETGETIPNRESLQLLSSLFNVSINTLLGSPRNLICQCCGMPLDDTTISREPDGTFQEDYCKWCYHDGEFFHKSLPELIDFLSQHMAEESHSPEEIRAYLEQRLPTLSHWATRQNP